MISLSVCGNHLTRLVIRSKCCTRFTALQRFQPAVASLPTYHQRCSFFESAPKRHPRSDVNTDAPIPYTTSKAANWPVGNSFGRHKKRPWYKVAPLSLALTLFLMWVFLRKETDIDRQLERSLHEILPEYFEDPNSTTDDNTAIDSGE